MTASRRSFAAVEDSQFLERVHNGAEAFRKGDMLRWRMRTIQQRRHDSGLQTDYRVIEVIQHLPRQTQLSFDA